MNPSTSRQKSGKNVFKRSSKLPTIQEVEKDEEFYILVRQFFVYLPLLDFQQLELILDKLKMKIDTNPLSHKFGVGNKQQHRHSKQHSTQQPNQQFEYICKMLQSLMEFEKNYVQMEFIDKQDLERKLSSSGQLIKELSNKIKKDKNSQLNTITHLIIDVLNARWLQSIIYKKIAKMEQGIDFKLILPMMQKVQSYLESASVQPYRDYVMLEANMLSNLVECKYALLSYDSLNTMHFGLQSLKLIQDIQKIQTTHHIVHNHNKYNMVWKFLIKFQLILSRTMILIFQPVFEQQESLFIKAQEEIFRRFNPDMYKSEIVKQESQAMLEIGGEEFKQTTQSFISNQSSSQLGSSTEPQTVNRSMIGITTPERKVSRKEKTDSGLDIMKKQRRNKSAEPLTKKNRFIRIFMSTQNKKKHGEYIHPWSPGKAYMKNIRLFCEEFKCKFDLVLSVQEIQANKKNEYLENDLNELKLRTYCGQPNLRLIFSHRRKDLQEPDNQELIELQDIIGEALYTYSIGQKSDFGQSFDMSKSLMENAQIICSMDLDGKSQVGSTKASMGKIDLGLYAVVTFYNSTQEKKRLQEKTHDLLETLRIRSLFQKITEKRDDIFQAYKKKL